MNLFQAAKIMLNKISSLDYQRMITQFSTQFSDAEQALLNEILQRFEFDPIQEQALAQAVMQQSRFDPNAGHWTESEEDEDITGVCPHCINPPAPPLRDYVMWREKSERK